MLMIKKPINLFTNVDKKVSNEICAVMGMGRSNSSLTYSTSVQNFCIPSTSNTRFSSPPITRKRRKSRATYSFEKNTKPSIKKCCSTLKKKLIVFKYMGPESPNQFTRKEQNVVMSRNFT